MLGCPAGHYAVVVEECHVDTVVSDVECCDCVQGAQVPQRQAGSAATDLEHSNNYELKLIFILTELFLFFLECGLSLSHRGINVIKSDADLQVHSIGLCIRRLGYVAEEKEKSTRSSP